MDMLYKADGRVIKHPVNGCFTSVPVLRLIAALLARCFGDVSRQRNNPAWPPAPSGRLILEPLTAEGERSGFWRNAMTPNEFKGMTPEQKIMVREAFLRGFAGTDRASDYYGGRHIIYSVENGETLRHLFDEGAEAWVYWVRGDFRDYRMAGAVEMLAEYQALRFSAGPAGAPQLAIAV